MKLSNREKQHTDYFRENGFTRNKLPRNKIIHTMKPGGIDSYFSKRRKIDNRETLLQSGEDSDSELDMDSDPDDADWRPYR